MMRWRRKKNPPENTGGEIDQINLVVDGVDEEDIDPEDQDDPDEGEDEEDQDDPDEEEEDEEAEQEPPPPPPKAQRFVRPKDPLEDAYTQNDESVVKLADFDLRFLHGRKTSIYEAYEYFDTILKERERILPAALVSNIRRHGLKDRWPDLVAAGAVSSGAFYIDPILGGVVFVVTGFFRTFRELWRIRKREWSRREEGQMSREIHHTMSSIFGHDTSEYERMDTNKLPDIPEFRNEWVTKAHRLIVLLVGYNARVYVTNEIFEDRVPELQARGKEWEILLTQARPRLLHVKRELERLPPGLDWKEIDVRINERLRACDPFGDLDESKTPLDWLAIDKEEIFLSEVEDLVSRDLELIEGYNDAFRATKDDLEEQLADLESDEDQDDATEVVD